MWPCEWAYRVSCHSRAEPAPDWPSLALHSRYCSSDCHRPGQHWPSRVRLCLAMLTPSPWRQGHPKPAVSAQASGNLLLLFKAAPRGWEDRQAGGLRGHVVLCFNNVSLLRLSLPPSLPISSITVDADEIKRLGKRFKKLDLDNSGSLSVEEFMSLPELQQNPLVQRVIDIFDTDGNGEVDFKGESLGTPAEPGLRVRWWSSASACVWACARPYWSSRAETGFRNVFCCCVGFESFICSQWLSFSNSSQIVMLKDYLHTQFLL